MNIFALIPARGGSKRLPRKNLVDVAGAPLIAWTIDVARRGQFIDRVYVSTDDDEIARVSASYGADVIRRPAELADDDAQLESTVSHAFATWECIGRRCGAVVLLQPTSPCRGKECVDMACAILRTGRRSSVVAVTPDPGAYFVGAVDDDGTWAAAYDDRPKTQDIPIHRETGALWAFTRPIWEETGNRLGGNPAAIVLGSHEAIDVDGAWDIKNAGSELRSRNAPVPRLAEAR